MCFKYENHLLNRIKQRKTHYLVFHMLDFKASFYQQSMRLALIQDHLKIRARESKSHFFYLQSRDFFIFFVIV